MVSTASLITNLKSDYPQFNFEVSSDYLWSPANHTIYYTSGGDSSGLLLHEISHGLLGHVDYLYDIDLIAMERAAWNKAVELSSNYKIEIDEDLIESNLDSYRDWLHARSSCPNCDATGLQVKKQVYSCPACSHTWRVNEARICALRRYDSAK
jgi:hypothetical protein